MPRTRSTVQKDQVNTSGSRSEGRGPSAFVFAVVVVVLAAAVVLWIRRGLDGLSSQPKLQSATEQVPRKQVSADDIQGVIARVSQLIVTRQNESPTVATIQDADTLRAQSPAFYQDAQNGDRLLVWSDKAVLYSTSRDLILAVLPVSLPPIATTSTTAAATSTPALTDATLERPAFDVRNGSGIPGLAKNLVDQLKAAGYAPAAAKNAKSFTPYPQTAVFKMNQKEFPLTIKDLMDEFGLKVQDASAAPAAELPSAADFLIIVGQNAKQ